MFPEAAVERIPPGRFFDIPELVRGMLAERFPIRTIPLREVGSLWMDLGRVEDYEAGCRLFEESPSRFLGEHGRSS